MIYRSLYIIEPENIHQQNIFFAHFWFRGQMACASCYQGSFWKPWCTKWLWLKQVCSLTETRVNVKHLFLSLGFKTASEVDLHQRTGLFLQDAINMWICRNSMPAERLASRYSDRLLPSTALERCCPIDSDSIHVERRTDVCRKGWSM